MAHGSRKPDRGGGPPRREVGGAMGAGLAPGHGEAHPGQGGQAGHHMGLEPSTMNHQACTKHQSVRLLSY